MIFRLLQQGPMGAYNGAIVFSTMNLCSNVREADHELPNEST